VKNGWLPVAGGWQINSIGMVRGDHRAYLIAVMTNENPDEGYGIDTIEGSPASSGRTCAKGGRPKAVRARAVRAARRV